MSALLIGPSGSNEARKMADRILTTHVGSLPRPAKLIELNHQRIVGEQVDEAAFGKELRWRGRRCRAPPEGGRHRPRQRRRVRAHDGLRLRLRRVVIVCDPAPRRGRGRPEFEAVGPADVDAQRRRGPGDFVLGHASRPPRLEHASARPTRTRARDARCPSSS